MTKRESQPASTSMHVPVLLPEAVQALSVRPERSYIDATFGGGGHAAAILSASPGVRLLGIDADPAAFERAQSLSATVGDGTKFIFHAGNFSEISLIAEAYNFGAVDGILLDLGMSSFQIDDPTRGFSFLRDGPLDMRFDPHSGGSAADLVNELPGQELADLIWRYGDERQSRRIAAAIAAERARQPFTRTSQLASVVERAVGGRRGAPVHPATRTFQALRIAVNAELESLQTALEAAIDLLISGGRLVVISFHSLEDRMVKQFIARESRTCICPPEQPVCTCHHVPQLRPVGKAIKPQPGEIERNPRSRSAIMRTAERVAS